MKWDNVEELRTFLGTDISVDRLMVLACGFSRALRNAQTTLFDVEGKYEALLSDMGKHEQEGFEWMEQHKQEEAAYKEEIEKLKATNKELYDTIGEQTHRIGELARAIDDMHSRELEYMGTPSRKDVRIDELETELKNVKHSNEIMCSNMNTLKEMLLKSVRRCAELQEQINQLHNQG